MNRNGSTRDPIARARHLTREFHAGGEILRAVDDVSLDVGAGEILLVMGPSGSGKTTLLSMLGGLLRPTSGELLLAGVDLATTPESALPGVRARNVGFVFQAFQLLDALTVEENVLLPTALVPEGAHDARERARALLDRLGLDRRRHARPRTLSGGEKQRAAIARALINRPRMILADEPTGNLDSRRGQEVTMILHDVARDQGCAVVIVTHDARIEEVADRVLWLEDGRLADRVAETAEWVRDPVCGMRIDGRTARWSREHDGRRYAFCSARCAERFEAEPAAYVHNG